MLEYQHFPTKPVVMAHLVVNCIIAFLMVSIVCLRIWARIYLKAGFGWDDAFVAIGAVSFSLSSISLPAGKATS